jgi:hypothetical protein
MTARRPRYIQIDTKKIISIEAASDWRRDLEAVARPRSLAISGTSEMPPLIRVVLRLLHDRVWSSRDAPAWWRRPATAVASCLRRAQ